MTMMMIPFSLLFSRLRSVLSYQSFTLPRLFSESASSGFRISSKMRTSPPRPVSTPLTEVASRKPCHVVSKSLTEFFAMTVLGEQPTVERRGHNPACVPGMFVRKVLAVASVDDPHRWIAAW